ncbi:hypothetical protein Bca4012_066139 [Brassica carinata]
MKDFLDLKNINDHLSTGDGSELTGPSQSNAWDTSVPCKRRTCVGRPKSSSSVEKLTKRTFTIFYKRSNLQIKSQTGSVHVLGSHSSPLCSVDLKVTFNFQALQVSDL